MDYLFFMSITLFILDLLIEIPFFERDYPKFYKNISTLIILGELIVLIIFFTENLFLL